MLYYGNAQNIQDQCVILNFTSFVEGYTKLFALLPPDILGAMSEYDFDVKYANYIMTDDYRFCQFFYIISLLYSGTDVYIIVSEDSWSEILIESLLKLIQQRYGMNAIRVNCFEDTLLDHELEFDRGYGLVNYDMDNERYTYISESIRLSNGGRVGG